jgi:signal transduction histidine kinase
VLFGASGELSQVVLNILGNARDVLRDKGTLEAYVSITLYTNDKEMIIEIADNGGGIPPEVLPKIFDPYFSTKNKAQGTGIGLYMSKTIIEKHYKGKLEAKNSEEGAIFTIRIPMMADLL